MFWKKKNLAIAAHESVSTLVSNKKPDNTFRQRTSDEIVAEIHAAFDSAEEKLLIDAKHIISKTKETTDFDKARMLEQLGFNKSKTLIAKKEAIKVLDMNEGLAMTIEQYQIKYPGLKFLTIDILDHLCEKYNLVYAPVAAFIEDVPLKNLKEIAAAKALEHNDEMENSLKVTITLERDDKSYYNSEFIEFLKKQNTFEIIDRLGYYFRNPNDGVLNEDIGKAMRKAGYTGSFSNARNECLLWCKKEQIIENNRGLFIAAPANHFDMTGLTGTSAKGFSNVKKTVVKDPIVFRKVKGGIQVLTKWGLEGKDPLLVNEVMN